MFLLDKEVVKIMVVNVEVLINNLKKSYQETFY
ncbi:Hypothetical protein PAU_00818 [Photorhabdus asymbiotica]|uniref:Uncharacterized protein n=1 Tax=Photorhabdus asymbiotica subsp. asymbiotica (strain ATCC 43949 / 3105-77) TaxID=553480 RepID=C7BMS4_PHOAA|nr:Hypothetical protein PAU_00818 [Photorhabdus asymbiotica]